MNEFTLLQDEPFTPIRPQKMEMLFSPSTQCQNKVMRADITYRVPDEKGKLLHHLQTSISKIGSPLAAYNYPRHSTGVKDVLKSFNQPANNDSFPNEPCASDVESKTDYFAASESLTESNANLISNITYSTNVPRYQPIYQIKEDHPIRATCFHPTGEVFAVGSNSRVLRICMYPTSEEFDVFKLDDQPSEPTVMFKFIHIHRGSIYCVTFNPQGNLLATGSNDQNILIIKYNSKRHMPEGAEYKFNMHTGTVRDLCFISSSQEQDSTSLVSAGAGDFRIHLTDCNVMRPSQTFQGHEATVMTLHSWGDSKDRFVSGSLDGTAKFWDLRTQRCVMTLCASDVDSKVSQIDGANETKDHSKGALNNDIQNRQPINVVRVDPTGKLLVSGHKNGMCTFYDIRAKKIIQKFQAHDGEIRTLNFSPKSYYLLTAGYDHKIRLVDLQGDLTNKLPCVDIGSLDDKVVQTSWHPNEYNFVTTSADGTANLWTMPGKQ